MPFVAPSRLSAGPVVSILDGDTIEILHNQYPERIIRLSGIDGPEKGYAYGQKAKQATSVVVFGKEVTLQTHGYDKYKRTPCRCDPARWDPRESLIGQKRLVVSEKWELSRGLP